MGALRGPSYRKSMGKALESEGVRCGALRGESAPGHGAAGGKALGWACLAGARAGSSEK